MRKFVVLLLLVFAFQNGISQEFEMIRHQVKMGETVRMLSKKYKVEPAEIYRLNKFAIDGISQGMVLQILVPKKDEAPPAGEPIPDNPASEASENAATDEAASESQPQEITHTVSKGETLFSLSRQYNVSVDDIKAWNEQTLKKGLQSGQVLTIRTNN